MTRARIVAFGCALMLVLGACTSTSQEAPAADETGAGAAPSASPEETTEGEDPAAGVEEELNQAAGADAEEITYDDTLDVIATREATFGNDEIKLELNSVRVSGELMSVLFTVTNLTDGRWQIASSFDSGEYSVSLSGPGGSGDVEEVLEGVSGHTTDGVTVTDDVNGKVYRAAYDHAGNCVCSSDLAGSFVGEGKSMLLSTRFAAPPADVETVSVDIPHFGTFSDVPVSR